ncbi:MAG: hypothetical protein JWP61_972 [Friedmanniella sp.]|nr:hypothetical protein [Friedmanniella sp.]
MRHITTESPVRRRGSLPPPPSASPVQVARSLHQQGIDAGDVGHLADAADCFARALRTLRSAPALDPGAPAHEQGRLEARVLLSSALPAFELGDLEHGMAQLAEAERVALLAEAYDLDVLVECQRGVLLLRAGRPESALFHLDRAVNQLDLAAPVERVKVLLNRGDAHHLMGHVRQARLDFLTARTAAQEAGLEGLVFEATHNLGFMEYLGGDLPRALATMPVPGGATSDYATGVVALDRAKVLVSACLFDAAEAALLQACEALARTDLTQLLAEAELERAELALLTNHPERARELAGSASRRSAERGNRRAQALADFALLRADDLSGDGPGDLVRRAEELAATLSAHHLPDQARTAHLIAVAASLTSAEPRSSAGLTARRGEPISVRLYLRQVRAQESFLSGRHREGTRQARAGLRELAEYQSRFGSLDLQTASAAHGVALAEMAITEELRRNRPHAVLDWLERGRNVIARVPEVQPPPDQVTADLLTQLRWTDTQIRDAERPDPELRAGRRQLEREIRARSWTLQGLRQVASPTRPTDLRAALSDATLVAVFLLRDQLHAVVWEGDRCWVRPLGPVALAQEQARRVLADLNVLALDLIPGPLRGSAARSLRSGLAALDSALLAPLGLGDRPLVLLPTARLAGLPWGQLPSLRGRPVTVAPSARTWLSARSRLPSASTRVVGIAGPGLSRAEAEIAAVTGTWAGAEVLVGADASGERVLHAMDGALLVHVAAHGQHQHDSPLFSSIRVADGSLVGYDLDRLVSPPAQVVLSACDLGQGTVRPGDESLGLTRAFLHSGTSTVISGVTKVSDEAAAELMGDYHRRLAAGAAPAYALAATMEAADGPLPFVCFGAGW